MKYIRFIPAFLLGAMLMACNTPKKLYEAQEYDQVIQRFAPDICGGDMNAKRINYVAASYHKANQADHERIQALKSTGQPDVWPEIYQRYCSMKGRNDALKCFPSKVKKGMNYVKLDLDDDIMAARNKAENYLVAKIEQLFGTGTKEDGQTALKYIIQLAKTNENNPNISRYLLRSNLCMSEKVYIGCNSEKSISLTPEFKEMVLAFDEGELPKYTDFETQWDRNASYVCSVYASVGEIEISPVRLDEVTFKETNGSKTVEVTDYSQKKSVKVSGFINVWSYGDRKDKPLISTPFEVSSSFKNDYTTIKGDREACSAETLSRLNTNPVPVPTDESMLIDAAKKLNDLIARELKK